MEEENKLGTITTLEEAREKIQARKEEKAKSITNYIGFGQDVFPKNVRQIWGELQKHTQGWPKICGGKLFYLTPENELRFIENSAQFYGYLSSLSIAAHFKERVEGLVKKQEFYEAARVFAEHYDDISYLPHLPEMPRVFYKPCAFEKNSSGLDELLSYFCPASEDDRILLKAMFMTPFWGGGAGARPVFVLSGLEDDSDNGVGVGKTTLIDYISELSGGYVDFNGTDSSDAMKRRILTAGKERVLRFDNIKSTRFSSADIEALITSKSVSGHMLYQGNASRPNLFTTVLTFNDPSFSKDMADRSIIIRLKRPERQNAWQERLEDFFATAAPRIIGSILYALEQDGEELPALRFGKWAKSVLAKAGATPALVKELHARQTRTDADASSSATLEEMIQYKLARFYHDKQGMDANVPVRTPINTWFAIAKPLLHKWVLESVNAHKAHPRYAAQLLRQARIVKLSHPEWVLDGARFYVYGPENTDNRAGHWLITDDFARELRFVKCK